jgi:multidrug efflux pump
MIFLFGAFNHGIEFFPDLEPSQAFIDVEAAIGTRLETSDTIVREVEDRIKNTKDMEHYVADVGNVSNVFDFGTGGSSSHQSRVTIDFKDRYLRSQSSSITLDEIAKNVEGIPGARIEVDKPQEGPPTGRAVEIQIKGEDFNVLDMQSTKIQKLIEDVPGISRLDDNYEKGRPELRIRLDREKAALLGLNTKEIANTIRTAINGNHASDYRVGTDEYDITVRFSKDYRKNYSDLLNLTVFYEGEHYPLANFATVEFTSGLSTVNHVDKERVVTITADALGRSSAEVLADVKSRLENYQLPLGYSLS